MCLKQFKFSFKLASLLEVRVVLRVHVQRTRATHALRSCAQRRPCWREWGEPVRVMDGTSQLGHGTRLRSDWLAPRAQSTHILNSSAARSKASGHWNSCVAAAARKITKPARGTSTLGHYLRIGAAKASRSPAGEHSPQTRLIIGSGSAAENGTLRVIFGVGFCPLGLRARVPWELLWAAALGTHPRKCRGRIRPRR